MNIKYRMPNGESAASVALKNGIPRGTFRTRLQNGWSVEDAATKPVTEFKPAEMIELTCENCGKIFKRKKANYLKNGSEHIYCTHKCARAGSRKHDVYEKKCETCGKLFKINPYKDYESKYCSKNCYHKARIRVHNVVTQKEFLEVKKYYKKHWNHAFKTWGWGAYFNDLRDEFMQHIDVSVFKTLYYNLKTHGEDIFEDSPYWRYAITNAVKEGVKNFYLEFYDRRRVSIEDCEPSEFLSHKDLPENALYYKEKLQLLEQLQNETLKGYKYILLMHNKDWEISDVAKYYKLDYSTVHDAVERAKAKLQTVFS